MGRVLSLDARRPDAGVLAEAARVLRSGGLVAFPTETVYGLGARAFDEPAILRVFVAKGRPAQHPLIVHVEGEADARTLAEAWPAAASRLARALWPGPLTLVVDRAAHVPAAVSGGGGSIALRAPSHAVARGLIAALGEPIAAPSANRYQGLSPTTAAHVVRQLGDAVDLVLDGGACDAGIESTVVDVRGAVRVLRPGAVGLTALRAVEPDIVFRAERAAERELRASPGMDERHYAPRAPICIASTVDGALAVANEMAAAGARVGLVVHGGPCRPTSDRVLVRELAPDAVNYARHFYAALHDLDAAVVSGIVVQSVPDDEAWWAIADRLRRAATPPSFG
jgi:L-threonylcarbamoyladenylate synthase